ncbi:MAG: PDZ domain-containing protein [Planctomycetota bacterium]
MGTPLRSFGLALAACVVVPPAASAQVIDEGVQRQRIIEDLIQARRRNGLDGGAFEAARYQAPDDESEATGPLRRIEQKLVDPDLSAEDRARLIRDGMDVFRRAPRAALGVQFGGTTARDAVIIERPIEGFPSAEYLADGDVILEIEGARVTGYNHVRAEILSRLPGERIPMLVRKAKRPKIDDEQPAGDVAAAIEDAFDTEIVEVPLGGYERLQQVGPQDQLLRAAWQARVSRLLDAAGITEGPALGEALTAEDWLENEDRWNLEENNGEQPTDEGDPRRVTPLRYIRVGGRPRDTADTQTLRRGDDSPLTQSTRIDPNNVEDAQNVDDRLRAAMDAYRLVSAEIVLRRKEILSVESGAVGGADIEERLSVLRENVRQYTEQLEKLRIEINELEAERDDADARREAGRGGDVGGAGDPGQADPPPSK